MNKNKYVYYIKPFRKPKGLIDELRIKTNSTHTQHPNTPYVFRQQLCKKLNL